MHCNVVPNLQILSRARISMKGELVRKLADDDALRCPMCGDTATSASGLQEHVDAHFLENEKQNQIIGVRVKHNAASYFNTLLCDVSNFVLLCCLLLIARWEILLEYRAAVN